MKDDPDNDLPDFDLATFLPYRLAVASARASAGLARTYRAKFGISVAEWRVLVHLLDAGEVSVRDLAATVNLDKPTVSRAASRLAGEGYVVKRGNEGDRRLVRLSLSPEGRALMARILPHALAFQAQLEDRVGEHLDALEAALDRLLADKP